LIFDTEAYFAGLDVKCFYPQVTIVFEIEDATQHYHVPLLLCPYGYSTYRGS
jgi:5-hydroxyisourate hydrolase